MSFYISIISIIISSLLASIIAFLAKKRAERDKNKLIEEIARITSASLTTTENDYSLSSSADALETVEPDDALKISPDDLWINVEKNIVSDIISKHNLTKEEIRIEVDKKIREVQKRISKIEARFPEEAKLEKITSINDAILSERIDQLEKQIETLEKRIPSKWDIAIIVSSIIAGIVFVIGATYGVINFFGK